jgi:MinD superfamily P-loop ATPase
MTGGLKTIPSIAVTGGKGGTGKTLIAINIAVKFANEGQKVLLIDCDVENPNTNILLGKSLNDKDVVSQAVSIYKPRFNPEKCTKCGKCRDACYRHAILQFPNHSPSLMEHMCSGCTLCSRVCEDDAIINDSRVIGSQYFSKNVYPNLDLLVGELNPSEAVSVLIIEEILKYAGNIIVQNKYDLVIIDTSPGAHCDVEKSISEAGLIICVTEPTPFGEHDLNRILDLIDIIGHNPKIILNRSDLTDYKPYIEKLAIRRGVEIIGEIPLDNLIIEDYAKGIPFSLDEREFPGKKAFLKIFDKLSQMMEMN